MAAFGARYLRFAQITDETAGQLPTYETAVALGGLIKADLTVNYASGEMYADDKLAEKVDEFISGSIAVEVDELKDNIAAKIYGATFTEQNEKIDNSSDSAPYGGLGYIKSLMKNKNRFFRAYYYPKVRAVMGNDNAATKASSISMTSTPINLTIYEPETGDWRYTKEFETVGEAQKWVDEKLGRKAALEGGA